MILLALGCGSGATTDAGKAAEDWMDATKDKDCEKAIGFMDLDVPELEEFGITKEAMIEQCEADMGDGDDLEVVSYKVTEEEVDGDTAEVTVEATIKENGEESTDTQTFSMIKKDGDWKIDFSGM